MAPKFDDLVKAGGKLEEPAEAAPRFEDLVKSGATLHEGGPISREPGDTAPALEQQPETTAGGAINTGVRGFIDTGSLGYGDEARAALGSIPGVGRYLRTPFGELFDKGPRDAKDYRGALAEIRGEDEAAAKENPSIHTGAQFAGALAAPGPGKAKGATMLARLGKTALTSGGLAGVYGLGNSKASLVDGEFAQAGKDAGFSAALGIPLSLIPGLGGEAGRAALGAAKRGLTRAGADAASKVLREADAGVKSAVGSMGGTTSAARNAIEVARELVSRADEFPADMVAAAKAQLASAETKALEQNVFRNALEGLGSKQGALDAAKAKLQEALAKKTPEALAAAEEAFLANPLGRQIWPRMRKQLVDRALIPGVTGAVGAATGAVLGDSGTSSAAGGAVGLGAGMLANQMLGGRPSSAFEKMMEHPAVRKAAWGALQRAVEVGNRALGRWEVPLAAAAAMGAEALQQKDDELAKKDPGYAAMKAGLVLESLPPKKQAGP